MGKNQSRVSRRDCRESIGCGESNSRREIFSRKESILRRQSSSRKGSNSRKGNKMPACENAKQANHPVVVWGVVYLTLASLTMILSSFLLLYCVTVIVKTLHWDLFLTVALLTGILMLPTNCCLLCAISQGKKIDPFKKLYIWDLWICMSTIIILSLAGASLCFYNMYYCRNNIKKAITAGMKHYKLNPNYRRLIDVLQWGLRCCGRDSYTDWFNQDWYDSIRDYEWDTDSAAKQSLKNKAEFVTDSVPLSCCKTGACISSYLMEMGTSSIHLQGCEKCLYLTVMTTLSIQLIMFVSVFVVELLVFYLALFNVNKQKKSKTRVYDVRQLLNVNPNFNTSASFESASEDSADEESGSPKKEEREVVPESSPEQP